MSKTYKNLFPKIYDFAALYQAWLMARRGKRGQYEIMRFGDRLEENLITLQNELIWKSYTTGRYHEFYISEPKKRLVAALPFRDRVVQHSLVAVIEPIFEQRMIFDSYACRFGKGTHRGADRAQALLQRVQRNHGLAYALKGDIRQYFASINHQTIKTLLRRRIACKDTLWLLDNIIDSTPGPGIPIGNLTSQLFANIYLHELDLFVKHVLKERRYVRYMDDFIILHHDKDHLQRVLRMIRVFLADKLQLELNGKTQIFPVARRRGRALDFLGYKIWATHRRIRKDSIRRMRRKQRLFKRGLIPEETYRASMAAWTAHAQHANTFNLRKQIKNPPACLDAGTLLS